MRIANATLFGIKLSLTYFVLSLVFCVALAVTTVIAVAGSMFSLYVYKENEESNGKLELIFKVAKDTYNFSLFLNLNLNFKIF